MSETILLDCPNCGRKIGVPGVSGTIHVTCPACKKQWDWPRRRFSASGAIRQVSRGFFDSFSERVGSWFRAVFSHGRFSGAHLVAVAVAGIGLGFFLGNQWTIRRAAGRTSSETVSIPVLPDTNDLSATNVLNPPGINPKVDDTIPTNLEDLIPAKTNK